MMSFYRGIVHSRRQDVRHIASYTPFNTLKNEENSNTTLPASS
jgi:hypothetical protein